MGVITKRGAEIKKLMTSGNNCPRGKELTDAYIKQMNDYHTLPEIFDKDIEQSLLQDELKHILSPKKPNFTRGLPTFSPSSASKCELELYYKATKADKDVQPYFAYQRRWTRNGSAIHGATQKDLLYTEKHLKDPAFKVARMKADGSPAWEQNLKTVKAFPDLGFQLFGMMDGVLEYKDGSKIGFEFKTKSTTVSAIGDYKLKAPQSSHIEQCIAYSLLFGITEFLVVYESLAKDGWNKGAEAKPDLKAFYYKVPLEDKQALLDKFTMIAKNLKDRVKPEPDLGKCIFCPYKTLCQSELQAS